MTSAGPAPGRSAVPAMAVPTEEKMPAPTVAPMPSRVSSSLPRARFSPLRWVASSIKRSTDLRRNRLKCASGRYPRVTGKTARKTTVQAG